MAEQRERYTFDRVVRAVISIGTLIAVVFLLRYLSDVLIPFVAAVVLAYLLNPLVTALERKTRRRGLAVGVTIGGLGALGVVLVVLVVPLMIGQFRQFGDALEKLRADLMLTVDVAPPAEPKDRAEDSGESDAEPSTFGWQELKRGWSKYRQSAETQSRAARLRELRESVAGTYIGDVITRASDYARSEEFDRMLVGALKHVAIGGKNLVALVVNLVLGLTGLIVVLLYLVFLLMDYPTYARNWSGFLPPAYRGAIVEFLEQFDIALRRYLRGQSVVAMTVGVLFATGFLLIGLPMAVPFGLFVGLLNMVPYLQTVGLVPAMLLAGLRAVEGDAGFLASVALTLAVFAVIQVIQDAFITPRVMGEATGLRPLAILLGVFIWGKLLGVLGLILAIPLTCLGIAYYRRFVLKHAPETAGTAET